MRFPIVRKFFRKTVFENDCQFGCSIPEGIVDVTGVVSNHGYFKILTRINSFDQLTCYLIGLIGKNQGA